MKSEIGIKVLLRNNIEEKIKNSEEFKYKTLVTLYQSGKIDVEEFEFLCKKIIEPNING